MRRTVFLLVLVSSCGRCGGAGAPAPAIEASTSEHGAPSRSAGCGKKPSRAERMVSGDRSYVLATPASYDPNEPYPLVLAFHGSGADGSTVRAQLDLERQGEAVFVYPNGVGEGWTLTPDGRDVRFVDDIVRDVESSLCIDERAVFAIGFSYGGWMVNALACARPQLLRGVVSIAGGGPNVPCHAHVAAMIIHGTNDFAEPLTSGEASRDHWVEANACSSKTHVAGSCVAYEGCSSPVLFCRHAGDHLVPDFAAREAWSFFQPR